MQSGTPGSPPGMRKGLLLLHTEKKDIRLPETLPWCSNKFWARERRRQGEEGGGASAGSLLSGLSRMDPGEGSDI